MTLGRLVDHGLGSRRAVDPRLRGDDGWWEVLSLGGRRHPTPGLRLRGDDGWWEVLALGR